MPVDLFPKMDIPVVNIITHYPGASAKDMEVMISTPVETKMMSLPNVKRVSSSSAQGLSMVTVEFNWGTSVLAARQLVQSKLGELAGILPQGAIPRIDNIGTRLQDVYGFVVYGSDLDKLYNITRYQLAGRLMKIDGVASVAIIGGDREAINVNISSKKLKTFHVNLKEIINALKSCNKTVVIGYIDRASREYVIRGNGALRDIKDIGDIPIKSNGISPIFLKDVAIIKKGIAPKHYTIHGDGQKVLAVMVRKQPGASSIKVVEAVKSKLKALKALYPASTRIKTYYDQSEIITESRREITNDLIIGSLLVFLVLYLFLGNLKPTLIVAGTIPITFITSLYLMHLLGLSLNVITMTALVLAIGMIVDDAIVVTENIYRHSLMGEDTRVASIEGTLEIAGPDASGTFTTIAAFLPLLVVSGIISIFIRPFGLTISLSLLVSLILSLSLVPVLFSRAKISPLDNNYLGLKMITHLQNLLKRVLKWSFKHKYIVVFLAALSLITSGLAFFSGRVSLLPPIDEGAILIEYIMPPGTSLKESDRIGNLLERLAMKNPNVLTVYRRTGSPKQSYMIEGVNRGKLMIKLKPKTARSEDVTKIINELKKAYSQIKGVVFLYHQPTQENIDESFSGLPALFGVTIYGDDYQKLIALSQKIEKTMNKMPQLNNIVNNIKFKVPQLTVRPDYTRLSFYHLSPAELFNTLKAANWGLKVTSIIKHNREIPVFVKIPVSSHSLRNLKNLFIVGVQGQEIPLFEVAGIKKEFLPPVITHIDGQREVTIIAEVEGNILSVAKALRNHLARINLPPGYSIDLSGQYHVLIKTFMEMGLSALLALILIYLIMVMQFRSFVEPLIILFTIPLSVVGASLALFITKQGLNISVAMGMITLMGIAVNNAIVLVDYKNKMVKTGQGIKTALIEAACIRLRPIILTSLTTISALIPTAIGTTVSSHIFQPFAITVIGGLLSATLATLIVVPNLILIRHKK